MKKLSSWETKEYYLKAKEGSLDLSHPGMKVLQKYINNSSVNKILDIGCGEGTRLVSLVKKTSKDKEAYGVDISETAIKLAKSNYPNLNFIKSDIEKVPFKGKIFDLIYSAYVLEHLNNPRKLLEEAKRLLRSNGVIILIAPNYGSPNRSSPCFKGSRISKLVIGYTRDLLRILSNEDNLDWNRVKPISTKDKYEIDWDCRIEPYLGSLISYLKKDSFRILEYSSCWEEESKNSSILQKTVTFLANLKIYPFKYWGPHFVLVARKIR
jgi:ubiquinone/menaquinone biosynthesis C-methylase UbiE